MDYFSQNSLSLSLIQHVILLYYNFFVTLSVHLQQPTIYGFLFFNGGFATHDIRIQFVCDKTYEYGKFVTLVGQHQC